MNSKMPLAGLAVAIAGLLLAAGTEPRTASPPACVQGPDYVPGMDVDGQSVPPADLEAGKTPVPDQMAVPVPQSGRSLPGQQAQGRPGSNRGGQAPVQNPAYLNLNKAQLDRLVNPPPCRG